MTLEPGLSWVKGQLPQKMWRESMFRKLPVPFSWHVVYLCRVCRGEAFLREAADAYL